MPDTSRDLARMPAHVLRRTGLFTPSEEPALARYCDHVARWLKLREKVNSKGKTCEKESKHGKLQRINPDLNAMMQIERSIESLEDRFALTPLMRFKLKEICARADGEPPPLNPLLPFEAQMAKIAPVPPPPPMPQPHPRSGF